MSRKLVAIGCQCVLLVTAGVAQPGESAGERSEEMEIDSTIPIDKVVGMYRARHGGAPLDDFSFLTSELERMKHVVGRATTTSAGRQR